ncbi:MAG: hypothetical protein E6K87_02545 [Thaumarchaeota archaeon]|nr:MAG: hypothetical protein E6K87_02545 [Nitrososphaerota archaeon]
MENNASVKKYDAHFTQTPARGSLFFTASLALLANIPVSIRQFWVYDVKILPAFSFIFDNNILSFHWSSHKIVIFSNCIKTPALVSNEEQ